MGTCLLSQPAATTPPAAATHDDDDDDDDGNGNDDKEAAKTAAAAAADYCYIITTNRGYYISIVLAMSCIKYKTIYQLVRINECGYTACYYCSNTT
jgi:hypothetical protein